MNLTSLTAALVLCCCLVACDNYNPWNDPLNLGPPIKEPLIIAARDGNLAEVQRLLAAGEDVNERSRSGFQALHLAVEEQHEDVVGELLRHGADPNSEDRFGVVPLYHAVNFESLAIVEALLKAGADADADVDGTEYTPRTVAPTAKHGPSMVALINRYDPPPAGSQGTP